MPRPMARAAPTGTCPRSNRTSTESSAPTPPTVPLGSPSPRRSCPWPVGSSRPSLPTRRGRTAHRRRTPRRRRPGDRYAFAQAYADEPASASFLKATPHTRRRRVESPTSSSRRRTSGENLVVVALDNPVRGTPDKPAIHPPGPRPRQATALPRRSRPMSVTAPLGFRAGLTADSNHPARKPSLVINTDRTPSRRLHVQPRP